MNLTPNHTHTSSTFAVLLVFLENGRRGGLRYSADGADFRRQCLFINVIIQITRLTVRQGVQNCKNKCDCFGDVFGIENLLNADVKTPKVSPFSNRGVRVKRVPPVRNLLASHPGGVPEQQGIPGVGALFQSATTL